MPARTTDPDRRLRLVTELAAKEADREGLPPKESPAASGPIHEALAPQSGAFRRTESGEELPGSAEAPASLSTAASLEEREDDELVALARAGQSNAFEALYRRHSAYAMALGVRVQGNPGDIEDIVHDAFLRVHDRLDSLRTGASFRPWLASVVVSLVRSRLRRRRMLSVLGLSTSDPIDLDSLVAPEAGPEVRAQIAQVYQVLQSVPVDHGICWTLRYVEGRKLEDVAEIAGCSLATAKRRIASVQERILLLEAARVPQRGGQDD